MSSLAALSLIEDVQLNGFNEFKLPESIDRALTALQFTAPTPIQREAIPVALTGRDLIGCAQTGSGKTAAFCIPALTRLLANPAKTALVLVPTRELAIQIDLFWKRLTANAPAFQSLVIVGGTAMQPQVRGLSRKPRLIVATPGRLVDHLQRRTARLSDVSILVLDEADRMLDMGFEPQLSQILKHLPSVRQTLFFTATWEQQLDRLAARYLRDPARVSAGTVSRAAPEISQEIVMTTSKQKNETLLDELNRRQGSVLVFARTKSRTDRVARYLSEYGVNVNRLHGGRSQGQRNAALNAFRSGQIRVLVATDIAARGIDVTGIGHVVNYDLPQLSQDYIHRIGRTGRAGASGSAVSLITPEDRPQWREISRLLERTGSKVPRLDKSEMPGKPETARASETRHAQRNPNQNQAHTQAQTQTQTQSRHPQNRQPRDPNRVFKKSPPPHSFHSKRQRRDVRPDREARW
jgi:superfamily II DNA/RNA helicase